MALESKVNELLSGLREEEKRLKAELSGAEARVKELKAEVGRIQSGIKGLARKDSGKGKRKRGSKQAQPEETMSEVGCGALVEDQAPA